MMNLKVLEILKDLMIQGINVSYGRRNEVLDNLNYRLAGIFSDIYFLIHRFQMGLGRAPQKGP